MVSRKSHPKSRNGCPECKKRRIKCDEVRPRCSNCIKHDIACSFAKEPSKSEPSPMPTKRRRSTASPTRRRSSIDLSLAKKAHIDNESPFSGQSLQPLQMDELELLHHFATITCMTLSDRTESHYLWRNVVPEIAFENEYLMRGILAISALHLTSLRPERHDHYARIAIQQQDAALRTFRKKMINPDQSYCDAFFAMSSLIVVYGFESPRASGTLGMFDYKGEHSDEWLPLIRGVNSILQSAWPSIKRGRLRDLLHDHENPPPSTQLPGPLDNQLGNLEQFSDEVPANQQDREACKAAIMLLRQCFIRIYNKTKDECEISLAFLWPVMIPQHFIAMINEGKPEALIILAYYCTILHHLNDYWWLKGWGRHIIENIQISLDSSLQEWILWPIEVVGVPEISCTNGYQTKAIGKSALQTKLDEKSQEQLASLSQDIDQHYQAPTISA